MKNLLFLISVFCLLTTAVAAAPFEYAVKQCKEKMKRHPPKLEIVYNYGNLFLDNTKNSAEIEQIFKNTHPDEKVRKINGLTTLSPYAQLESSIQAELVNNRICYYPQNVRITIGYNPVVYISKDISKRGCQFALTIRHEQTHLDIGHLSLDLFAEKLKNNFPRILSQIGPIVKTRDEEVPINEMSATMNQAYHERLKILFDDFVQNLLTENARIDTDENYQEEKRLCPD